MRDCVGLLVESARVPTQKWHSLWQSTRVAGIAIDFYGLGVTNHGRDDDSTRRTAAKPFGMESTRSGMPQQRLVGKYPVLLSGMPSKSHISRADIDAGYA